MKASSRYASAIEVERLARAIRVRIDFLHEIVTTSAGLPSRWFPEQVFDPRKRRKQVFVAREAWRFVLELLERGEPVEVVSLDRPPGEAGWVLKANSVHDPRLIYIKLQLDRDGYALGRSFHYSDPR
jgi:hypothetical protein